MKILSGQLKGRNFYMPEGIRPTQNLVRKAIFDILGDITGMDFLELFAGSGAVGFEAFSRGAKRVTLVEGNLHAIEVIRKNMEFLQIRSEDSPLCGLRLIVGDVFSVIKHLSAQQRKFDIIFLDPPYGQELGKKALKALGGYDILHPNSFIILQADRREILPESEGRFLLVKARRYGGSCLRIYKA